MYVYLKSGGVIRRFRDVELVDCTKPQVDGVSVEGTDPAVWFKVLLLDSVLIDCDDREVYWNKDTVVEATDIHWAQDADLKVEDVLPFYKSQGKLFDNGCYDFDVTVDELFDEARWIVSEPVQSESEFSDDKESVKAKEGLLRLLHVFILPKLRLGTNFLKAIQTAITLIENQQKQLKVKITNKERSRNGAEKSLEKQRKYLLTHQDFSCENHVSACNHEFLKEFQKHLQQDVLAINKTLLKFEKEMSPLRKCETEEALKKLSSLQEEREPTLSYLNLVVMAKQTIKNVITGRQVNTEETCLSKESKVHPNHIVYMEAACRFQNLSDELNELTDAVAKLTSVKETASKAKCEIEEHGESYGPRPKSDSVLNRRGDSGEWTSLSQKVDELVSAKPLGYRNKHKKFCKKAISKCQKLFNGSKSLSSCGLESKENVSGIETKMFLTTGVLHEYGNKPYAAIEAISKEVIQHNSDMADALAEELYKKPLSTIRQCVLENIYISYECHISEELMPVMHQLYENCCKHQCESLSKWISQKKLSETLTANVDSDYSAQDSVDKEAEMNKEKTPNPVDMICNKAYGKFETLVKAESETMSVFAKLRSITEMVQYVEKMAREEGGSLLCTDDILDLIISLLQKLDSEYFLKLYAHINLLRHLSPDFVEGNCHEYALITFYAAYQHLFDQHVLEKVSKKIAGSYSKVS